MSSCSVPTRFHVTFAPAAAGAGAVAIPIPVLAGSGEETLFHDARPAGERAGFRLFEQGEMLIGVGSEPKEPDLAAQAGRLYRRLLALTAGRAPVRIWNYVPQINAPGPDGLENYRAFCRGRSLAFEQSLGQGYAQAFSSASAVGGPDDRLAVIFVATAATPLNFENPEQVPAYHYPDDYGPRAPSFARATRVAAGGKNYVFISGTAAIKGHATIAPGNLTAQIDCTLDNLRLISRACALGDRLDAGGKTERHFKVYLRDPRHFETARVQLQGRLLLPEDRVTWLQSDICRAELEIEIEATLVGAA